MKTTDKNLSFLRQALDCASESARLGGFPAGAIIVKDDKIIAKGFSLGRKLNDPTEHSETSAIRKASREIGIDGLAGCTLYSSMEPCLMCFSVANWAGIKKIVYGCKKSTSMVERNYYEGKNDIVQINESNNHRIELEYIPDYEEEVLRMIRSWENKL